MSPDGKQRFEYTFSGHDPIQVGSEVSRVLKSQGADKIIQALNEKEV